MTKGLYNNYDFLKEFSQGVDATFTTNLPTTIKYLCGTS